MTEKIPREREISPCPCDRKKPYEECCMRLHYGRAKAGTALELMRSRYTAYYFRLLDYLVETNHPDTRDPKLARQLEEHLYKCLWRRLKIVDYSKGEKGDNRGKVKFTARYDLGDKTYELQEHSRFRKFKGLWKYYDDKG